MIGLLDYDLSTSTASNRLIPNIEIMKLATYYKNEENQFCHLLSLNEQELTNYDKIYCFSELNNNLRLPDIFLRENIIYGGTAFTNEKYIPFKNEIIDYTLPKPFIYKEFLKQKYDDGIKAKVINHVLDDSYYRMYAGDKQLPLPPIIPHKRVFLYDRQFFYYNWEDIIKEISLRKPSSIIRLHPIICHTLTEYFTMRNYPKLSRKNDIILDIEIPPEEINYMLKNYSKLFLADIMPNSTTFIFTGKTQCTNVQYFQEFIYKLNLLYAFWSKGIFIKIKYKPPVLGAFNPISNLMQAVEKWTNNISIPERRDITLNEKIPKKIKNNILKDEKQLLIETFPTAETLFNQTFNKLKKEGRWRF